MEGDHSHRSQLACHVHVTGFESRSSANLFCRSVASDLFAERKRQRLSRTRPIAVLVCPSCLSDAGPPKVPLLCSRFPGARQNRSAVKRLASFVPIRIWKGWKGRVSVWRAALGAVPHPGPRPGRRGTPVPVWRAPNARLADRNCSTTRSGASPRAERRVPLRCVVCERAGDGVIPGEPTPILHRCRPEDERPRMPQKLLYGTGSILRIDIPAESLVADFSRVPGDVLDDPSAAVSAALAQSDRVPVDHPIGGIRRPGCDRVGSGSSPGGRGGRGGI